MAFASPARLASPAEAAEAGKGWFAFEPEEDGFGPTSALRSALAEREGGRRRRIHRDPRTASSFTPQPGKTVRFWGVDGPPDELKTPDQLRQCARLLAKHGVNLVRLHAPPFDAEGNIDPGESRRGRSRSSRR